MILAVRAFRSSKRIACIVCAGCAALYLASAPFSAPGQTQTDDAGGANFRSDTNLVVIPVDVTDAMNRFVLGLQKEDFRLYEDGVEQQVAHFSGEDAPLSIGVLFDESGSMDYKMRTSRDAAAQFLKTLNQDDEAFLVEFGDTARVSVELTSDADALQKALKNIHSGGLTAMLDAINTGLGEMKKAKNPRKAIVVVSDGGDNNSKYTSAEIEELVRAADVQIYTMGVFDSLSLYPRTPEEISGPKLLSEISSQTGGRAYAAALSSDLPSVANRIAVELRNQYVLGYYPKNQARDGKYRKVEVKVTAPRGISALKTHWRLGYYAPAE
ncbi:MAG TPA: VWA domain-containing protein [Bryobacteraceae bacterium]|nr:VWA domain-containing protein [Bryobacteraceae bacterium]